MTDIGEAVASWWLVELGGERGNEPLQALPYCYTCTMTLTIKPVHKHGGGTLALSLRQWLRLLGRLSDTHSMLVPYEKFAKHVCLLKGGSFLFALKPSEIVGEFGDPTKCCSFSVLVGVCPNTQYTPIVLDYWRMTNTVWIPKDFGNGLLLLV